ncbi:hypothetical protein INT47_003248 [Mucor saturninus]|uniref:Phorbol-ester/DAG-type domain-containing protein n=1 Tax=Mucor saturninus TaxID=64648 RepID=A0A8H7VBC1_9FUNG|nr:hypothetical protein INT47_003248 [Mucor saturninus]
MTHVFVDATFSRLTYCDHCQGLLWGLVKQGSTCTGCGMVCHPTCGDKLPPCTHEQPQKPNSSDSPATKSLRTLQERSETPPPVRKPTTTAADFEKVIVSAAIHSSDPSQPVNEYLANLPRLNAQNTAKNFSRFVSRCGPMFSARDQLILLLSWDKPIDTSVALLLYCILCLHPKLMLLVPHAILLQLLITGYNKRFKKANEPTSNGRFKFFTSYDDESSPEYLRNMQNLQNMMGELSDVYDLCASHAHYFDWSSEESMRLFQGTVLSLVLLCVGVWMIPLQWIALVGGISVFLLNTRFAKFVMKEMMPQVTEMGQKHMETAVKWYTQVEKKLDDQENQRELSLYENQRWWSGSGFIPHMLSDERGLWSDITGDVAYAAKEELPAPKGYHWIQDNWTLDTTGPWMDDTLGLEVMVHPESGGWVYTDTHWSNPRKSEEESEKSVTRRRRWIRQCEIDMKYST